MTAELHQIQMIDLPVALHARSQEHNAELMREMYLIAHQDDEPDEGAHLALPARLLALVDELGQRFAQFTTNQDQRLLEAIEQGVVSIDVSYELPEFAVQAAQHLADIFDEADEFCQEGQHLLTLATPTELVTYRQWFLSQIIDQLAGAAATPWPEYIGS